MTLPTLLLSLFLVAQAPAQASRELKVRMVEQINADRRAAGLTPVQFSEQLSRAADAHCAEMLREGYASHWNRAGWKPYLRYASAGIRDSTAENIWSHWGTELALSSETLWAEMLEGHQRFLAETPPLDGHRRTILNPAHTHVGIGVAHTNNAIRMIQVFATQGAVLEPLPVRATLAEKLEVRGRVPEGEAEFFSLSVFYEPLPREMSLEELRATNFYALPQEEWIERPRLSGATYTDGTRGSVAVDAIGNFSVPLLFWKKKPGVYTVAVWVRSAGRRPAIGAMASVIVEAAPPKPTPPL